MKAVFFGKGAQQHLDMILFLILGCASASVAKDLGLPLPEEPPKCNCSHLNQLDEEDITPTFPTTTFTCWGRYDGYYADVEVDCTIFHYCQTWHFPTGANESVKWDFACPQSTIFNQKVLTCTPPSNSFDCQDSPNYYWMNYNFTASTTTEAPTVPSPIFGQQLIVGQQSASLPAPDESSQATSCSGVRQTPSDKAQPPDFSPRDTKLSAASLSETPSSDGSGFGQPPDEVTIDRRDSEAIKFPN